MNNNSAPPFETLIDKVEDYTHTSLELLKLRAIEKSADVASVVAAQLVIVIVAALFFVFGNIGLALWLGEELGKTYYGFFVVGGFYSLVLLLVLIFKYRCIIVPISNSIITHLLKTKNT